MNKSKKYYFTPTPPLPPPKNTQVNIRCSHCSKYEVCRIREDYLKTAFLIEEILGHPSSQRELSSKCQDVLWGFKGFNFEKPEDIFLEEISIENIEEKASFEKAKYRDRDTVQMAYKIWDYILIFNAIWNEEKEEFYINNGREIRYGAVVIMEESSQDAIKEKLKTWRESYNEEKENDELDIINTTYFSSILNCDQ